MSAARAAKRRGLREALKSRKVARAHFDIVVGDGDLPALVAVLEAAEKDARLLEMAAKRKEDEPDAAIHGMLEQAREFHAKAQSDLDEQAFRVWFHALTKPEFAAIRLAHPAPGDDEPEPEVWSRLPVLAAACAEDSDLTVDDWAAEIAKWPGADQNLLSDVLHKIHLEPASSALAGKAFGTIR